MKKKIAIIGSGISGLTAALELQKKYEVHVYEKNSYLGGHTHTHEIFEGKKKFLIDSGFIVFNNKTYPNFIEMIKKLKVNEQNTNMSFSVNYPEENFEWSGKDINSLIFKNKNFFSIKFYKIIIGIIKFNILAKKNNQLFNELTIDKFLKRYNFSGEFIKYYLYPMCSSIWSNPIDKIKQYKTHFLIKFFINHGLVNIFFRPQWKVIKGGSNQYVKRIIKNFKIKFLLNHNVNSIKINKNKIFIKSNRKTLNYDFIIFSNHTDEIKKILPKSFKKQKKILSLVNYQQNEACIHTDNSLMPKNKFNWSSWNFINSNDNIPRLTYWMNYLQNLKSKKDYFVSINSSTLINHKKIIKKIKYSHPVFKYNKEFIFKKLQEIQGVNNIFYCGAWCGYGFHEDGVVSAKNVVKYLI
ncbi:MAG: FAD-dependent oxidoreductase [Proteobacteria bacterium]|nr:FAD-dependent oxidoreductase [Pseudomonadota bacterium]